LVREEGLIEVREKKDQVGKGKKSRGSPHGKEALIKPLFSSQLKEDRVIGNLGESKTKKFLPVRKLCELESEGTWGPFDNSQEETRAQGIQKNDAERDQIRSGMPKGLRLTAKGAKRVEKSGSSLSTSLSFSSREKKKPNGGVK